VSSSSPTTAGGAAPHGEKSEEKNEKKTRGEARGVEVGAHGPVLHPPPDRRDRHRHPDRADGAFALKGLSIEQYPFLAPPMIRVTANYPGASAVAVEQSVAIPIEQEVNGVDR
jgi:hypothetical protein